MNVILELADWRRLISEMYTHIRSVDDSREAHAYFTRRRDDMFRNHSQSPIDPNLIHSFEGLRYFDYDPAFRLIGTLAPAQESAEESIDLGEDGIFRTRQAAEVEFSMGGNSHRLILYWICGYGGGLFLPFRDATAGTETYGGGRYLFDTIKGADLGTTDDQIVLDFNFAYNPSCAYSSRWVCPLAPPENNLAIAIRAGEKTFVQTG